MDQEIVQLRERLEFLNCYRNSLASLSFLPDEILSQIFFEYGRNVEIPFRGTWTKLMLVCKKWRQIGLNHAALWSFISLPQRSKGLTLDERLQRSAQYPLTLNFFQIPRQSDIPNRILLSHSNRTRYLNISATGPGIIRDIFKGIDALPAVAGLTLVSSMTSTYELDQRLQRQVAPNLRWLSLFRVGFHAWDLVSNLNTLTLQGSNAMARLPSFRDILCVLSRSPRLAELVWKGYWNQDPAELDGFKAIPFPAIQLVHLTLLDVTASLQWMELIIDVLKIPPMATLSLMIPDSSNGESIKHLLVPIKRHLHRPGGPVFRSIALGHEAGEGFRLSAHTTSSCPMRSVSLPGTLAKFSLLTRAKTQLDIRSSLRKLIHALPFDSSSVNLNSCMPTDFTLQTWQTVGTVLPQLKEIQIGMGHDMVAMLKGFLSVLEQGPQDLHGRSERRLAENTAGLRPSKLSINFLLWRHRSNPEGMPERPQRFSWFNSLLHALERYRDLETVNKPAGEKWEALEFERHQGSEEYDMIQLYRDRLLEVAKSLTIDGEVYEPVE